MIDHLTVWGRFHRKDAGEKDIVSRLYWVKKEVERVEARLFGVLAEERKMAKDLERALARKKQVALEFERYGFRETVCIG